MSRFRLSDLTDIINATAHAINAANPRTTRISIIEDRPRFDSTMDEELNFTEQYQMRKQLDMLKVAVDTKLLRMEERKLITATERYKLQQGLRGVDTDVKTKQQFAQACVILDAFEDQVADLTRI